MKGTKTFTFILINQLAGFIANRTDNSILDYIYFGTSILTIVLVARFFITEVKNKEK